MRTCFLSHHFSFTSFLFCFFFLLCCSFNALDTKLFYDILLGCCRHCRTFCTFGYFVINFSALHLRHQFVVFNATFHWEQDVGRFLFVCPINIPMGKTIITHIIIHTTISKYFDEWPCIKLTLPTEIAIWHFKWGNLIYFIHFQDCILHMTQLLHFPRLIHVRKAIS